jgi:hypothetical protein
MPADVATVNDDLTLGNIISFGTLTTKATVLKLWSFGGSHAE